MKPRSLVPKRGVRQLYTPRAVLTCGARLTSYCPETRSRPKAELRAPGTEGEAGLGEALNAQRPLGSHEIVGEFPSHAGYAAWINRQQQDVVAYIQEENRILKSKLEGKRIRFTDDERRRLARWHVQSVLAGCFAATIASLPASREEVAMVEVRS